MSKHRCHIPECGTITHPTKLMCPKHWAMVPSNLQREVLKHFERDQCEGLIRPSIHWLKAARYAINSVTGKGIQWPEPIDMYDKPAESQGEAEEKV